VNERLPMKKKNPAIKNGHVWPVRLGAGIFLLAFALVIYLPSFKAPFHLDDWGSVVNNSYVRILDLKPSSLWRAAWQDGKQNRPLSNLSLALNFYFGGLDPAGYHAVNLLFLGLTALGVWLLLERLLVRMGFEPKRSGIAAWLSALLWAAHPLNTQAVTYIVQRHASFAGAFSVWSIYFFHLGLEARKRRPLFYSLCALCTISAILCKETALVLPALIFLYKVYFFDELKPGWLRSNARWIITLAVFYALAAAVALRPEMLARLRHDFAYHQISAWGKFLSAPRPLFWYLCLILFPFPQFLSLFHEFPLSTGLLHPFTTVVSWAAFLAAVFIALARARRWRIFSFAVLWYLGSLAVEAMPLPIEIVYEHRLYLALLSVLAPACSWPVLKGKSLKLVLPWAMAIALFFGFFTFSRNRVWTSNTALWEDVHKKFPKNADACNNLGAAAVDKGRLDLAVLYYTKAMELDPNNALAYDNRGVVYGKKGQLDLAIKDFNKAIELDPEYADAYNNLGAAYIDKGRIDLAIQDLSKALELDSKFASAYNNLGAAYVEKGQLGPAIQNFSKALELNTKYAAAYRGRGVAYFQRGQLDPAIQDLSKAIELNPKYAEACNGRGAAYQLKGQLDLAIRDYSRAIELDPQYAEPYYNRGLVYKAKAQPELAQKDFDKAIELDPKFAAIKH